MIVQTNPGADDKYPAGTTLSLLAQPAEGYVFAHWSGAASGTAASTQITLNADTNVVAHFRPRDPGSLRFSLPEWVFDEAGGTAQLSVVRTGAGDGAVSAGFRLAAGGTATAGTDFTLTPGTLSWADGETGTRTFTIGVVNDAALEPSETVRLELVDPTGGAALGTPATATVTVTIADNDADPSLVDTGFTVGADAPVHALAVQPNGWTVVGGRFTKLGGQPRNGLGRLVADGTPNASFNQSLSNLNGSLPEVHALAVQANRSIVVGGRFDSLGGWLVRNLAALTVDGGVDATFNPQPDGAVYALALSSSALHDPVPRPEDGRLYAAGHFAELDGHAGGPLGLLYSGGARDPAFSASIWAAPGTLGKLDAVAVFPGGAPLIAGNFNRLFEHDVRFLGQLWNPTFKPEIGRTDGTVPRVHAFALQPDGKILVAGDFDTLGGQSRRGLGRLRVDGTLDASFNPAADGTVRALMVQADGKILAGGDFTTLGGQPRSRLARLHPDGSVDAALNPGVNGPVHALALQPDGKVVVAGDFTAVGGLPRQRLARLGNPDPATQSLSFDANSVTWLRGGSSAEVWHAEYDYTLNGIDWLGPVSGTRVPGGWRWSSSLPTDVVVRARGYVTGGNWIVEEEFPPRSQRAYALTLEPYILAPGVGGEPGGGRIVADPLPRPDGKYSLDTVVTLGAQPDPGYVFDSWGEAVSGTSPTIQVTVTGALTIRANFHQGNPGSLAMVSGDETVNENQGAIPVVVSRQSASEGEVSVGYRLKDGTTATPGQDFTVTPERLVWANGELGSKSFTITILDDTLVEPEEAIHFELANPAGGTWVDGTTPTAARFTLVDNDVAPRFAVNFQANPAGGGSTQAGPEPGQDGKYAAGTVVTLTAVPATGYAFVDWSGAASGSLPSTQVTLNADATVTANFRALAHGTIAFTQAEWSVAEGAGSLTISAARTGGSDGAVSVGYRLAAGGTATKDTDFTLTPGTLNWADGETGTKSFTVTLLDDATEENAETIELELANPASGVTLGSPALATVTVADNGTNPPSPLEIRIARAGGNLVVQWSGGSQPALQFSSSAAGPWTTVAGVTTSPYPVMPSDSAGFWRVVDGERVSKVVGYVNQTVAAGASKLIQNPLSFGANTLEEVIPAPPERMVVRVYFGAFFASEYDSGQWNQSLVLSPGLGFFVQNVGSSAMTLTFIGEVVSEGTPPLGSGLHLVGSPFARGGALGSQLQFPLADGDVIYQWNAGTRRYEPPARYSSTEPNWDPGEPAVGVGEAFFLQRGGSGAPPLPPGVSARVSLAVDTVPGDGGGVAVSPLPGPDDKYDYGTVVTLTATPATGYAFANWSGAASGTSTTTQLTLVGDTTVTAHFVTASQPPVSSGFAAATAFNQPLLIPYTSLLEPVHDPEGQPVHIVAVGSVPLVFHGQFSGTAQLSTNGALVIADGARATYIPKQDFVGADRFSYVVADGANVSVTVYAQIAVLPPGVEPNAARELTASDADGVSFRFAGLPGRLYEVQRSSAALGPWQKIGELTISPDGNGFYADPEPPTGSGFYRTVLLPHP